MVTIEDDKDNRTLWKAKEIQDHDWDLWFFIVLNEDIKKGESLLMFKRKWLKWSSDNFNYVIIWKNKSK